MGKRPTNPSTFMRLAMLMAERSTCSERAAVGAVLVNDLNQIVATGYNGAPRGMPHCDEFGCTLDQDGHCIASVHAEVNAIVQCAISGGSSAGTTLYVTHSPCLRCIAVVVQAGIERIVYGELYGDGNDFNAMKSMCQMAGIDLRRYEK